METSDWLIIFAAIAGPVLAVQAQKAIERIRERRHGKLWCFHTLMATRAARVSADHVKALNMIDLLFWGSRVAGMKHRTKTEQSVLDCWREYHDHLNTKYEEKDLSLWSTKGEELFINLLFSIAQDVGFSFDRVQLKRGSYTPVAHGNLEVQQEVIRRLSLEVLAGDRPIKMAVTALPVDEQLATNQRRLTEKMTEVYEGTRPLNVSLKDAGSTSNP